MSEIGTTLGAIVQALNALSPLGLAGMLGFIIWQLIGKKGNVRKIAENHLHDLPTIVETLSRIEQTLTELRDSMNYLKGMLSERASRERRD